MLLAFLAGVMNRTNDNAHRSRRSGALLGLLLLVSWILAPPAQSRSFAFESLRDPLTALQTARGGPQPSELGGAELIRANPAWLASTDRVRIGASHRSWQIGLQQQWSGAAWPLGRGTVALEGSALHAGELPAFEPDGSPAGSFHPVELVVGAGFGAPLGGGVSAGLSGQLLYLDAPGDPLRGFCLGAGIGLEVGRTRLGLALRNLGPEMAGENGTYRLPAEAAIGATVSMRRGLDLAVS
ncbi:MAG: hypothetical protein GF346_06440, partial [Candidatus Eisenbacteria bacterium]|nr:hypothetical protein [Candidatus Latescibacterota bacterium]MBD3302065.1 hypothetical protein [Candidatus Eisenbacteria bacterium]